MFISPVIGVTTQIIPHVKWYKYVHELGVKAVEINRRGSALHLNLYFLEKVKRYLEEFDLSIHSGTSGIFQPYESLTKANLATLTAEVDLCRILGARQLVFHLDDGILSPESKDRLRQVFSYATDQCVDMLYESNSALVADYAYDVLETFPEVKYVLDLGHLNYGYVSGKLGCEIDEFIRQVRKWVVYVHASNNFGKYDENNGLENGTLDWRHVLNMLDLSNILKIIMEVRSMEMVQDSKMALMRYLGRNCPVTEGRV